MYKEKYLAMINVAEDKDTAEFIYNQVDSFRIYVNTVLAMELQIPILRFRCNDTEEYQQSVMELDKTRRSAHERAIDACNILNRYCKNNNIDLWFDGDTNDRYAVAAFCEKVVSDLFLNGIEPKEQVQKMEEEALLSSCK